MPQPRLSVIIPTRNRPDRLPATIEALARQEDVDELDYEVIIVDDGSDPPAAVEASTARAPIVVERLEGAGRSVARNRGAEIARGELLIFIDDDSLAASHFLAGHWTAHLAWPGALQVGSNGLPEALRSTPFGRFRERLEQEVVPDRPGPVEARNFSTAQNMALERQLFSELGGFDPDLGVAEDQDLAMRHTGRGGRIVFVPKALAIHDDDSALTLETYCERAEGYMAELVHFGARYPDWPDTVERARVNGPTSWGSEPISLSAKKTLKRVLLWAPVRSLLLRLVSVLERRAPDSALLDRLYRTVLGAHLLRGYRRGLEIWHG